MHGNHPQTPIQGPRTTLSIQHRPPHPGPVTHQNHDPTLEPVPRVDWTTWWPWRGAPTRSHPELGRENPQRPWYCASRHGRVGRRQVLQSTQPRQGKCPGPKDTTPQYKARPGKHPGIRRIITPAGWSSPVARQAHNLKVTGSNPVPATKSRKTVSVALTVREILPSLLHAVHQRDNRRLLRETAIRQATVHRPGCHIHPARSASTIVQRRLQQSAASGTSGSSARADVTR